MKKKKLKKELRECKATVNRLSETVRALNHDIDVLIEKPDSTEAKIVTMGHSFKWWKTAYYYAGDSWCGMWLKYIESMKEKE